ncbi:hypothetical protein AB0K15_27590 [Amycolatopsis sp. NPDC049253]|uniref:hypothetical protein n=1 Tax=Amycolatopsis sp. NPDC049253 TaxID=3155274 RepID=UPI00342B3B84
MPSDTFVRRISPPSSVLWPSTRTAVRLYPAQGEPAVVESHLRGLLLWPTDEPWPTCPVTWPPKPEATDDGWTGGHPDDEPLPAMVGAAQLYRRDFPELPFPDGSDLAQVLLCPTFYASKHHYGPAVRSGATRKPSAKSPSRDDVEYELGQFSKVGGWTAWYAGDPQDLSCRERLRQAVAPATPEDEVPCGCGRRGDEEAGWEFGEPGALNIFLRPTDPRHPVKVRTEWAATTARHSNAGTPDSCARARPRRGP